MRVNGGTVLQYEYLPVDFQAIAVVQEEVITNYLGAFQIVESLAS